MRGGGGASKLAPVFVSAVGSTMKPGDRGTAKLVRHWGDRLVSLGVDVPSSEE